MSAPVWRQRRHASRLRRALARADRQTDAVVAFARRYLKPEPTTWQIELIRQAFRERACVAELARMHAR